MDLLAARPGLVLNTVEAERWSPEPESGCNHGLNEVTHAEASPGLSVHSSGYVLSSYWAGGGSPWWETSGEAFLAVSAALSE